MYFQRMIEDDKIGFNYEYMGYAEFEHSVTRTSRAFLATAWLDMDIDAIAVDLEVTYGMSKEKLPVIIISSKEMIKIISGTKMHNSVVKTEAFKCPLRAHSADVLAWMTVGNENPMFIIRNDAAKDENFTRLEKYLKPFVDQIKESRLAD